jgi:hypothetical protein
MSESTITIGSATKELKDADSAWIASQLNGRKHEGPVCVRVRINTADVDISLSSGGCAGGGGEAVDSRTARKVSSLIAGTERVLAKQSFQLANSFLLLTPFVAIFDQERNKGDRSN